VRLVIKSLLLVCVYIFSQLTMASPLIVHDAKQDLAHYIEYIEDQTQQLTIQEVLHQPKQWQMQKQDKPYFGYSKSAYWLKVDVQTTAYQQSAPRLLEVAYPLLDDIQIFLVQNQKVIQQWQLGDKWLFEQREIPHHLFIVPINLAAQQHYQFYFRIQSSSGLQVPISLWPERSFWQHDQTRQLLLGCFYGSLIIMIAYNFFIWLSVREKSYLFYVIFVIGFGVLLATIDGLSYQYLWPNAVWWNNHAITVLLNFSLAMSLVFGREFLNTRKFNPRLHKLATIYMNIMFVMAVLSFYVPYQTMIVITLLFSMGTAVLVMTIGICNWRAGNRAARFFVGSWLLLASMVVLYDLSQLGIIPKSTLTNLAVQIGEWCEVLLLSFALADRINISRMQEQEAQNLLMAEERRANAEREEHLQTKLKAQEEEIRAKQAINQAQSESRAKSLFLATMSHEIRTPMNAVLGVTQLLENTSLTDVQQHYINLLKNSGKLLISIINDILDYSKIEAGKLAIENTNFNLHQLLTECASLFAVSAKERELPIYTQIAGDVPQWMVGDPTRIRQVIINMLGNAYKFTERGAVTLRAKLREDKGKEGVYILFEVEDTGIGITSEQRERLFQSFSQADSSVTRKYGGTGLGLAISRSLVRLMNGDIGVKSIPNQGSTFWFYVQLYHGIQPIKKHHIEPNQTPFVYPNLSGLHVLIAEDNPTNQMVIVGMLKKYQIEPIVAVDGQDALSKVMAKPEYFDVVFMDCEMPKMDGYTATKEIKAWINQHRFNDVLIFGVSAHALAEYQQQGLASGMNAFIVKPLKQQDLLQALTQVMAHKMKQKLAR